MIMLGILASKGADPVQGPNRRQTLWIAALAAGAHAVALHILMRRYITGVDVASVNLNDGKEWWWGMGVEPMSIWLVGSVSFGILAGIIALQKPVLVRGGHANQFRASFRPNPHEGHPSDREDVQTRSSADKQNST